MKVFFLEKLCRKLLFFFTLIFSVEEKKSCGRLRGLS